MNITSINSSIIFASKRQEKKKTKLQEKRESQTPYNRYRQKEKEKQVTLDNLSARGIQINKSDYPKKTYDENGQLIYSINKLGDGTLVSKSYDENNKMISAIRESKNGNKMSLYLDENEVPISMKETNPNGESLTHLYDEDGSLLALIEKSERGTNVRKYNKNKELTGETTLTPDGSITSVRFNQGENKNETIIEVLTADDSYSRFKTKLF